MRNITAEFIVVVIGALCVGALIAIARISGLGHSDVASLLGAAFGAAAAAGVAIWVEERRRRSTLKQAHDFLVASIADAESVLADIRLVVGGFHLDGMGSPDAQVRSRIADLLAAFEAIDSLKGQTGMLDLTLMKRCHRIVSEWDMSERIFQQMQQQGFSEDAVRSAPALWNRLEAALR